MKEILLQGDKRNIIKFISNIPEKLKGEWELKKVNEKNYDYNYLGNKYVPFRVSMIIINNEYNLKWIIPLGDDKTKFDENMANRCMKFFLSEFDEYAKLCNITFAIDENT